MFVNAFSANSSLSFKISYITFNPKLTPTDMQRQGNKLLFAMRGAVAVEGGYGILYSGFTETLELPE